MRFMVIVPSSPESESGVIPEDHDFGAMTTFNEQLTAAGVMLAGEGLLPSAKGARIRFDGTERTVIDGPFTESKELVAGFWIWECASKEEAIEWVKRAPFDGGTEIELRQVATDEDFGDALTDDIREREAAMRAQNEARSAQ